MSQKNSNTVALERRMDLASLFCMIGRHGPAVALAVIAMVSVLAGFIIYRTVRGKRRKATAAAADGESKSPAAESDASVIRPGLEPSPEEPHSSAESTDVSDEGSSVIKEDTDLFQSDLQIRHRRAAAAAAAAAPAAEKKTPPYFSSKSDDQIPESKHTTSDDTEEMTVLQDSNKVAGASHNLECDAYRVAEMEVEDAADGQQGATDGSVKDVIDSWSKEPDLINDEIHAEEEKVFKAEDQEDKNVNVVKDVSDEKTRQEDENFQCGSNNQVFFNQTSPMSGNVDDDRLQDNETTPETNSVEFSLEEPIVHIKEPNLPSSQQHDAGGLAGEVTEEDTSEGHVLTATEFDIHPPQSGEQQPQTEQTDGNGLTCNQEKVALPPIAGQEKEKKLTSDDTVACGEECDSSSVVLSPALHCLNESVNVNNYDDDLSIVNSDTAKAQISGIVDFPDLPLDCQQPQSEVKDEEIAPPLDKDTDLTVLDSDLPPLKKAIQCENNETGEFIVLAEESTDLHMINNEAFDKSSVAAGPDTIENLTASVKAEEMPRSQLPSICQDETSDHLEFDETLDETMVISATDAAVCDNVTTTTPVMSEEISRPDMLSFSQDQQSVQTQISDDFSKFAVSAAPKFDAYPPQSDEQQRQIEQADENGLICNKDKGSLPPIADQEEEKKLTSDDTVACGEECDSSSVVLSPALHCLNEPVKVDNFDDDLSIVNSDQAQAQISGIVDFPDLPLDCQQPQSEVKDEEIAPPLDKDTDLIVLDSDLPSFKKAIQCENNETGEFIVLAEESTDLHMVNNDAFDESRNAAGPDTIENPSATMVISATEAAVCDIDTITTPVMSEEISRPDALSFSQDQQSVQTQNNEDLSELTISARPVMTVDLNPPMCQIPLTSLEKSELRDNDKDSISSPGVEEESGISSMAVSPDLHEFDMTVENMPPVTDCDAQSVKRTVAQNSLFADGVAIPDYKEDTVGMVFGPFPSRLSQQPHSEHMDESKYESFAANEDMFGHEIEDSYHRAMEQFAVQIAASTMSVTDELKNQTDVKSVVEVVEIKEKKKGVSVAKKVEAEAEKQKEEDYEKTNISIMEATMDNNEWITDSNNQVLPWMNLSVPPFAQDRTKTEQLPTEDCQPSPSVTDATCIDTDTPPSTEVKQTSTLSLVDENTENNKKVVAVQPMPQNVNVTFRIHYVTHSPYQTVAVTGNQQELGNWKEFIPLERAKDGHWATVVSLPVESHVEWKFVLVDKGEVCRWEECGNRLLDTGYGDDLIVHKWWGFL
ncbi:microtubule-associated protein futsch [Trachinotus anak]|uniref:microtubule-associated protein futsch n=1 Tax=Trachinotus anak TaxID=443729 RepID=UPI0039F1E36E